MTYEILNLREHTELLETAAAWFHAKWGVPLEAYQESMAQCVKREGPVPQWYAAVSGREIIGGLGVIENDFHNRKDLSPNVCAVYVEEKYRCQGIAGKLLRICPDLALIRFTCWPTTPLFMNGTAGSSSAWPRETARRSRLGSISAIGTHHVGHEKLSAGL